jgi:hypothetical protein
MSEARTTMDEELEKLKAENDALRKRMEKLEEQVNPPPRQPSTHPRYDPTEGASMPRSAMLEMMKAVPESVMRGIRADAWRPNPVTSPSSMNPTSNERTETKRGSGWQEATPLGPPSGIAQCDALMDAQDRIDKAELALKFAKAGLVKRKE